MTTIIPMIPELSNLPLEDLEEIHRLLVAVFERDPDPPAASLRWLKSRSEVWNCTPLEMIQRDELGVVRVISYLDHAARNSPP